MASSVADPRLDVPRRNLKMDHDPLRKTKGVDAMILGRVIERAFEFAEIDIKEAAIEMGYTDPSIVYRWCAGKEPPNFQRLWSLGERWREGFLLASAPYCTAETHTEHVVRLPGRRATA